MQRMKFWVRPPSPVGAAGALPPPRDGGPTGEANPIYRDTVIIQRAPQGTSGTHLYGGFFFEDYLTAELHGQAAMDLFDKMRRSDAVVTMVLNAVKQPIIAANWTVEPVDDSDEERRIAKHVEHALFNDIEKPWKKHVEEALSMEDFGFSVFEITHKIVENHPVWGTYTTIASLGFRHQRTIFRWKLDPDTGRIDYISQLAVGDLMSNADIPGEFILHFARRMEGDNFEGISALRPIYGAWKRKQLYLKLMAIGVERTAVPTVKAEIPDGKQTSVEYNNLVAALMNLTSHENNYLTYPAGWKIDQLQNNFDAQKVKEAIDLEDMQIVRGFQANFLLLGQTNSGSRNVSQDQSAFFYGAIQHEADTVAEGHNRSTIKQFVRMNYGERAAYPKLKCTGISDKAGKELSDMLKDLATTQFIRPDDPLEDHLRKELHLPKRSDLGVRIVQAPKAEQQGDNSKVENPQPAAKDPNATDPGELQAAEGRYQLGPTPKARGLRAKKYIHDEADRLKGLSKKTLRAIADRMIEDYKAAFRNGQPASRLDAVGQVKAVGRDAYRAAVRDCLASAAKDALDQARKEVPKKKSVKLAEERTGTELSDFDKLPAAVRRRIQAQSDLLVGKQVNDLEASLGFQYSSSVEAVHGSDALLGTDLDEAADRIIDGAAVSTGSVNTMSQVVNSARSAFFFDDDVLDEIYAFQFVNSDPQCPLCQDLNGSVFEADDAEAQRYMPPLHHFCACIIVPILKGEGTSEITGLKPSKKSLEDYVTLAEKGSIRRCNSGTHHHHVN